MKDTIISHIPAECPWRDTLYWFDTIDSTNTRAKLLANQGAPHGTVILAARQTAGRGRMGRSFFSPEGNGIYLSVILRPRCSAEALMHLTCGVAAAATQAVHKATGLLPQIKWINDLVVQGKKLGGILTELSVDPGSGLVQYAVVGLGINCRGSREHFPAPIRDIAISLETALGSPPDTPALVAALIHALWDMDKRLLREKTAIMNTYRKHCVTLGQQVKILRDNNPMGIAESIDPNGALLVRLPDGRLETVNSGEVSVRGLYGYV